jgi:multiple sugar transport system permease protein
MMVRGERGVAGKLETAGVVIVSVVVAAVVLVPIVWMVSTAFKPGAQYFTDPPTWIPHPATTEHFSAVSEVEAGYKSLFNSLIAATCATLIALCVGTPAAYGLARLRRRGDVAAIWFLSQRILPPVAIVVPIFLLINRLHWVDTLQGLIIPYSVMATPYVVWMMRGYFIEVPIALEESAMSDGCTRIGALVRVVIPTVLPGLLSTAVIAYIFTWSDFLIALFITRSPASTTAPVQMSYFDAAFSIRYGEISALGLVSVLPLIVLGLLIQRYFVRGLTLGAVKG